LPSRSATPTLLLGDADEHHPAVAALGRAGGDEGPDELLFVVALSM